MLLVGWLRILLCISVILEFRMMEQHLSRPALVTTAGGKKRVWQSVSSRVLEATFTHSFLAKPIPMVIPKFNWVKKHSSTKWSEEQDQMFIGEQPKTPATAISHIHNQNSKLLAHVPDGG